ncbi:malectin-like [Adelges cooleyi]|uniref:malectin-like n=1 Tax=Adelges cooleyi TaxID=133065 RepID=UPI00217F678E|nr:malectin-like [Adelges cooleyi]
MWSLLVLLLYFNAPIPCWCLDKDDIILAVNAGGDGHVDSNGILFQKDLNTVGTESDYGKKLTIQRVQHHDQILYQTERYSHTTFGYDIPIKYDGDYVMVLKFSEVYFTKGGLKVFDVVLNNHHIVVPQLDIFERVGFGTAHDEIIEFNVVGSTLYWGGEISEIKSNMVRVDFIKGERDNPKINAILVIRGKISDIPILPDMHSGFESPQSHNERYKEFDDVVANDKDHIKLTQHARYPSGPRSPDPYESTNMKHAPFLIALGAFFVALVFLCKL